MAGRTGEPRKSPEDYEVGYGKPPKQTQFKRGQSGNPKGRPKSTKNLKTDLMEELNEKVVVREGGTSRPVSKQRALVKALCAKAIQGDVRAINALTAMTMRLLDTGEGDAVEDDGLHEDELGILREFEERVRQRGTSETQGSGDDVGDEPEGAS